MYLSELEQSRLAWRTDKIVVDSRKVVCRTFDQVLHDLRQRLVLYTIAAEGEVREAEQEEGEGR